MMVSFPQDGRNPSEGMKGGTMHQGRDVLLGVDFWEGGSGWIWALRFETPCILSPLQWLLCVCFCCLWMYLLLKNTNSDILQFVKIGGSPINPSLCLDWELCPPASQLPSPFSQTPNSSAWLPFCFFLIRSGGKGSI